MKNTIQPLRVEDKLSSASPHCTNLDGIFERNSRNISEHKQSSNSNVNQNHDSKHVSDSNYEFCTTTSLHGFAHFADAPRTIIKVFWGLIILLCVGAVLRGIYRTIEEYVDNPTVTSVTKKSLPAVDIPDISVCLPHRVNKSFVEALNVDTELLEYMNGVFLANHPNPLSAEFDKEHIDRLEAKYQAFLARSKFKQHHIEEFYEDGALDCNEVFRKCDFGGYNLGGKCCDHVDKIMMSYGTCFLFDPVINGKRVGQLYAGPHGGITLLIQIHPQVRPRTFYNSLHDDAVYLHIGHAHLDYKPVPLDNRGIIVAPAQHAFVALKARHIKRLKGYGCHEHKKLAFFDGYEQQTCLYECMLNETSKRCGCVPLGYNVSHRLPAGAQTCNPYEGNMCVGPLVMQHTTSDVTFDKIDQYHKGMAACSEGCGRMCDTEEYSSKVMYSRFPSRELGQNYMDYYNLPPGFSPRYQFSMIEIYFSNIEQELVLEVMSSTIDELISNIGGQLGLFIGSSVISLVHIIAYWTERCYDKTK